MLGRCQTQLVPSQPGGAPLRHRSLTHHEDPPVAVPVNAPELEVRLGLHGRCPGGAIDEGQLPKAPAFTDAGHPLSVHVHLQGSGDSVGGQGTVSGARGQGTVSGAWGQGTVSGARGHPPSAHTLLQGTGPGGRGHTVTCCMGSPPQHPRGGRRSLHPNVGLGCALPSPGPAKVPTSRPAPPGPRLDRHKDGGAVSAAPSQAPGGRTTQDPHLPGQAALHSSPGDPSRRHPVRMLAPHPGDPSNPAASFTSCPPVRPRLQVAAWPSITSTRRPRGPPRRGPPAPRAAPKHPGLLSMGAEASAQG